MEGLLLFYRLLWEAGTTCFAFWNTVGASSMCSLVFISIIYSFHAIFMNRALLKTHDTGSHEQNLHCCLAFGSPIMLVSCFATQMARLPLGRLHVCGVHPRFWPDKKSVVNKYLLEELIIEEKPGALCSVSRRHVWNKWFESQRPQKVNSCS